MWTSTLLWWANRISPVKDTPNENIAAGSAIPSSRGVVLLQLDGATDRQAGQRARQPMVEPQLRDHRSLFRVCGSGLARRQRQRRRNAPEPHMARGRSKMIGPTEDSWLRRNAKLCTPCLAPPIPPAELALRLAPANTMDNPSIQRTPSHFRIRRSACAPASQLAQVLREQRAKESRTRAGMAESSRPQGTRGMAMNPAWRGGRHK